MKPYRPKDYEIRVWWSEEDESFLAQVLDMPGIMTHGETPEDAARENYAALQLALDSLSEAGQEAPAPQSRAGFHASTTGASIHGHDLFGNVAGFDRILAKVPDVPPMPGDELPSGYAPPA